MYFLFSVMILALASGNNPKPEATASSTSSEISLETATETIELRSDDIFRKIIAALEANPAEAKAIDGVFLINITNINDKVVKQWTFDLRNAKYYQGPAQQVPVDVTFTMSDADAVHFTLGELNVVAAYMTGKLKISGNYLLAFKLGRKVQQLKSKLKF